jgi:uncharacterized coiled-coil DUF342 family protein
MSTEIKSEAFERLLDQIDAFIRKFYKNELLRGLLFFVGIFLVTFLSTTVLEYFGRFGSVVRGIFFFGFILSNLYVLVRYILLPLSKLYAFGQRISRYQAAEIIGKFFPDISDRLKNTLQLQDALSANTGNLELLRASVQQRSGQLSVVPFASAVNFNENRKYLKLILPLILLFIALLVFVPTILKEGTNRVVNYDKEFKPKAPFEFYVNEEKLDIEDGEDASIELNLKGSLLPEKVYLVSENGKFVMNRVGKTSFSGVIRKPKGKSIFYFEANDFESDRYAVSVTGKSMVGKSEVKLNYPSYLNRLDETLLNSGDLVIPEGTNVTWNILTKNTANVDLNFNGKVWYKNNTGFRVSKIYKQDEKLRFNLRNAFKNKVDTVTYKITVIKDAFPAIFVEEQADSVKSGVRYFKGSVEDDYGLKSVYFIYSIISENGKRKDNRLLVKGLNSTQSDFDFGVDFRRENLQLNDRIEYYFMVYDNDGVNGSKSTRSQTNTYKLPGLKELIEQRTAEQNQTKQDLSELMKKTDDFQKRIEKLKKETLNSKSNDWIKLNQVQQLKEEQNSLINKLEQVKNEMENSVENKNQLSEMDKELLDKQEMIEKLLEELMDDELKKLLDELEKLLQENDKQGAKEKLEELQMSAEDMKKQMDRSLEMLKRLQVNEKIDDIEKGLKELAKEQEQLKKEIENKKIDNQKGAEKQDDLNKRFDVLKKDLEDLNKLNDALEKPMELGDTKSDEQKVSEDMKGAKESLSDGKQKKGGEKQQSAADKMKEMADKLDKAQQKANQKQQQEDINSLRSILESLMILSFEQERIMSDMGRVGTNDPAFKRYGRGQRRVIDDTKIVKDSLMALAKRQPKIASFVDKEIRELEVNHKGAIEAIDDHKKKELAKFQQFAMTSYNNLALLLNESLQSMQSQMQSEMEGSGSCSSPGKGRPKSGQSMSPGDMKEMLKKQLEQMQKGFNPGGQKPGDQPGQKPGQQGGQGMMGLGNKEMARMAAEQTAIRQRLEQMRNELNKEGKGLGNKLNPLIKELEEQEKQLINKNINRETINRQKEILTRLLESENALMERGFDEKRESKSGKDEPNSNQIKLEQYKQDKQKQIEILRSVDPTLRKYYKDKTGQYFNQQ